MAHISIRKVTKELNLTKKIIMSYNIRSYSRPYVQMED